MTRPHIGRLEWRCLAALALFGCRGPEVGPPRPESDAICEEYCAEGRGCDQDCVHACEIGRVACVDEWDDALTCAAEEPACDAAEHLPRTTSCASRFDAAYDCAPTARCAIEGSRGACEDCCIAADDAGWNAWSVVFARCACGTCFDDCGTTYCGTTTGSELECVSCYEAFCLESVTAGCDGDPACLRYDACITSCPRDESSHCSEHPTFDACNVCCLVEFPTGAAQWVDIWDDCACGPCGDVCLGEVCGNDMSLACQACTERECPGRIETECATMAECTAFENCYEACPQ